MCLILRDSIFAFAGSTLFHATDTTLEVIRPGKERECFNIDVPIQWMKVSPNGQSVLIYGKHNSNRNAVLYRWRERVGIDLFATTASFRENLGYGFILAGGSVLTMLSQSGMLRGLLDDGNELFAVNIQSPHSYYPYSFVQLPGERITLLGFFFSDHCDTAITVNLNDLIHDPEAIQKAINVRAPVPVRDRAIVLAVGPCEPSAAVVFRDPKDEEIPEDEEDLEDLGDVGNFAGVYVRDLDTGVLIERYPYSGQVGSNASIAATANWIVVQVSGGIDMIHRKSGVVHQLSKAILDVVSMHVAQIRSGDLVEIVPIDRLI
jgi:hypothetical protein